MITFEESILMTILFAKYWARFESRTDITKPSKDSFHITNGLLYRNRKFVFQICMRSKREFFFNAMMHPQ